MNGIKNKRKRDEEFEDEYEIEEDGMNYIKQIEDNMDEFEDPSMNNYQSQEQSGNKGRGRGRSNRGRGSINNNGRGKSRENRGRGGKKNDFCQIQVQDNQIEMQNSNQIKISQSQHQQISSSSSSSPILSPQAHFLSPQNIDARPLQTSQQQTHNSKSKSKAVSRVKVQATLNEQQQRPKSRLQQSLFQQPDTPDLSSAVPVLESFDGAKQVMPRMKHALLRVENLFGYGNENSASSEMSNENLFN
ncbi:MAG: hypothetical protein EZS28_021297 [Streblomastix strix]|uniref:Uncharacterized protein n=1 Tax=Streblomastix strix TaxID=222440 RepID=A0A5J4VL20_9EUKA|nr:MAG: hypothetical protein EZS28_021297 [Streblomastix strix]